MLYDLIPQYEKDNYEGFAEQNLAPFPQEIQRSKVNFLWNQLLDGHMNNPNFFSHEAAVELRKHIPDIYFSKREILYLLNRLLTRNEVKALYSAVVLLHDYFDIPELVITGETAAEKLFYETYMQEYPFSRTEPILHEVRTAFYTRENILMWFIRFDRSTLDIVENNRLWNREAFLLDSKSPEFIELALEKGFLDRRLTRRYVDYVMDFRPEVYNRLVPVLIRMECKASPSDIYGGIA